MESGIENHTFGPTDEKIK